MNEVHTPEHQACVELGPPVMLVLAAYLQSPERAVFGTANRDNEGKRFISQLHNSAMPNESSPGPGTYR